MKRILFLMAFFSSFAYAMEPEVAPGYESDREGASLLQDNICHFCKRIFDTKQEARAHWVDEHIRMYKYRGHERVFEKARLVVRTVTNEDGSTKEVYALEIAENDNPENKEKFSQMYFERNPIIPGWFSILLGRHRTSDFDLYPGGHHFEMINYYDTKHLMTGDCADSDDDQSSTDDEQEMEPVNAAASEGKKYYCEICKDTIIDRESIAHHQFWNHHKCRCGDRIETRKFRSHCSRKYEGCKKYWKRDQEYAKKRAFSRR